MSTIISISNNEDIMLSNISYNNILLIKSILYSNTNQIPNIKLLDIDKIKDKMNNIYEIIESDININKKPNNFYK